MNKQDLDSEHESTKRVLYHLVNSYQTWRNERLGVPNEFTDDAVRIGEQHLREVDWFPEDEGWLAHGDNTSPYHVLNTTDVLTLIDAELARLKDTNSLWGRGRWRKGVLDAREAAAWELQHIRDAYVMECLTRETESMRLYGIADTNDKSQPSDNDNCKFAKTFIVGDLPCPNCGRYRIIGHYFTNEKDEHMHTHYICTFWPTGNREGLPYQPTERCGWHGWSVPGWNR